MQVLCKVLFIFRVDLKIFNKYNNQNIIFTNGIKISEQPYINSDFNISINYDKYDTLANYRIDRITKIRILDEERKPISKLSDGELNLPKHMAEHVYMFAGESIRAKFKAKNYLIDQIVDWFGTEVSIKPIDEKDEECMIEVVVNKEAFFCWAMQYSIHIEVMEPVNMRERISKAVRELNEKYNG